MSDDWYNPETMLAVVIEEALRDALRTGVRMDEFGILKLTQHIEQAVWGRVPEFQFTANFVLTCGPGGNAYLNPCNEWAKSILIKMDPIVR